MTDQASTLRFMASTMPSLNTTITATQTKTGGVTPAKTRKPRYVAVTGGKGGVGKSNVAVNLAIELGALNKQVNLLDADFGLANADLLCGMTPRFHLGHVIKGVKDLDDILISIAENVRLIPSGSGFEELANLSLATNSYLFAKLRGMDETTDFTVIDTAAGIAENVAGVVMAADEVIVVVTPEPTSIVDAYATIKLILRHAPGKQISVVVNSVVGVGDAEKVFLQIHSAVRGFLNHDVEFLGMIPHDAQVGEAVREQIPVVRYAPEAPASRAIRLIARQFCRRQQQSASSYAVDSQPFWEMFARD